MITKQLQQK